MESFRRQATEYFTRNEAESATDARGRSEILNASGTVKMY